MTDILKSFQSIFLKRDLCTGSKNKNKTGQIKTSLKHH